MFDDDWIFGTWSLVLIGAVLFGMLFGIAAMVIDAYTLGHYGVTRGALIMAALAAAGYLGVAIQRRRISGKN